FLTFENHTRTEMHESCARAQGGKATSKKSLTVLSFKYLSVSHISARSYLPASSSILMLVHCAPFLALRTNTSSTHYRYVSPYTSSYVSISVTTSTIVALSIIIEL